ncbi:MAG TPA: alpha-amylase family glycosyl hydrolase [bacterium]|jgi:glycosidase
MNSFFSDFHLSRLSRERYRFNRDLLLPSGRRLRPDTLAVQELAYRMNLRLGPQGRGAKPGHVQAMILLQYILHVVVETYRRQKEPQVLEKSERWLEQQFSADTVFEMLRSFADHYPPLVVYRGERTLPQYLEEKQDEVDGRHRLLELAMLVYLANINPAAETVRDLYDDREFAYREAYLTQITALESFLATLPPFGPKNQTLFELLTAPMKAAPHSILGQLAYIRENWVEWLGEDLVLLLLSAEDIVREEEQGGGPGPGIDPDYLQRLSSRAIFENTEVERFSTDKDWMPQVVLMAKSIYVWLDQLSRKYGRLIRRLDEIPDEELDLLAHWGFTGLWMIGVWERSEASRRIKHIRGNVDAVASAYSLYQYRISADLGGDAALDNLRERALKRGIRLASDLVPNHMGIDSVWTRMHPDWFIQLNYSPYGAYSFTGPDLSDDPDISIRIEDGYWRQTDAAVVFQRVDKRNGDTRFIYHGNDGTSMPWNDTAQLNFLIPQVREAMIQQIIDVAKRFPILRFDAAMTLTRKHYQRLWYPEPGTGGAIPSRSQFGLTKDEFDRAMPEEFWRQVVDRVAEQEPETLLLAEAFWLLEGYFVRTLGMHRVYNSAFMNMLKLEENAKYRQVIKNLLEFDPRILQRFVNFMNNPDEDTAVAQFGKGDKYFGVAIMMATMPGLPMFGHGQIEGYTEKYGHEYQRAYYDELPDEELVHRHERDLFPILRKRHLFSGADHFVLYDVFRNNGEVDENVFAFSNGYGDARALVVFHNKYAETSGWIHRSAAFAVPGDGQQLIQKTLSEGLDLKHEPGVYYILRDHLSGLEYLRRATDLASQGLFVSLKAYQCQVFTDIRELKDDESGHWSRLCDALQGRGVPSIEREFKRVVYAPVISAFEKFASADRFKSLLESSASQAKGASSAARVASFVEAARPFLEQAAAIGAVADVEESLEKLTLLTDAALCLHAPAKKMAFDRTQAHKAARDQLVRCVPARLAASESFWRVLCGWLATISVPDKLDTWLLSDVLQRTFRELGATESQAWYEVEQVRVLLEYHEMARSFAASRRFLGVVTMLNDPAVLRLIGAHLYGQVMWFNRESFNHLLRLLYAMTALHALADPKPAKTERARMLAASYASFTQVEDLSAISEYQLERLRVLLGYAAKTEDANLVT